MGLNVVTVTTAVLSVAFSVDFIAHMAHAYTFAHTSSSSRAERLADIMSTTGLSVFSGGWSTLLGVSMLSWAPSVAYTTFFFQVSTVVLVGLWNSLAAFPVAMLWVGPLPSHGASNSGDAKKPALRSSAPEHPHVSTD